MPANVPIPDPTRAESDCPATEHGDGHPAVPAVAHVAGGLAVRRCERTRNGKIVPDSSCWHTCNRSAHVSRGGTQLLPGPQRWCRGRQAGWSRGHATGRQRHRLSSCAPLSHVPGRSAPLLACPPHVRALISCTLGHALPKGLHGCTQAPRLKAPSH